MLSRCALYIRSFHQCCSLKKKMKLLVRNGTLFSPLPLLLFSVFFFCCCCFSSMVTISQVVLYFPLWIRRGITKKKNETKSVFFLPPFPAISLLRAACREVLGAINIDFVLKLFAAVSLISKCCTWCGSWSRSKNKRDSLGSVKSQPKSLEECRFSSFLFLKYINISSQISNVNFIFLTHSLTLTCSFCLKDHISFHSFQRYRNKAVYWRNSFFLCHQTLLLLFLSFKKLRPSPKKLMRVVVCFVFGIRADSSHHPSTEL